MSPAITPICRCSSAPCRCDLAQRALESQAALRQDPGGIERAIEQFARGSAAIPKEARTARPIRIAFDVGGVLSKRPEVFIPLIRALVAGGAEVYVLSDMHPVEKIFEMLALNGIDLPADRVISADYAGHVELCKTRAAEDRELDILIDDFVGYVAHGNHIRLLMMPDASRPYYAPTWRTDGAEGDFGRRTPAARGARP